VRELEKYQDSLKKARDLRAFSMSRDEKQFQLFLADGTLTVYEIRSKRVIKTLQEFGLYISTN